MHLRYRLERIVKKKKELEFVEKVPVYPRDRLIRKMKKTKDELEFIKKLLQNPRDWLNREIKKDRGNYKL